MKIISWNVWGMFSNPNFLSSPIQCINEILSNHFMEENIFDRKVQKKQDLKIVCIQECWMSHGFFITKKRSLGLLCYFFCLFNPLFYCFKYNPIKNLIKKKSPNIHFYQDLKLKYTKGCNSGLLFITNKKVDLYNFEEFQICKGVDHFANKGFLWITYHQYKILCINLHLQSEKNDNIKFLQLQKVKSFIHDNRWLNYEIYIIGDFNLNIKDKKIRDLILNIFDNFYIISNYSNTTYNDNCYDFILHNKNTQDFTFQDIKSIKSDHKIITCHCHF